MALDARLRYPNEQPLFALGAIFSGFVWLVLAISIIGLFYAVVGLAFALIAHALFLANIKGNGVRVSTRQFPDLHLRCQRAAGALGLGATPEIYLVQAGGSLNAFATKLFSRKFVIIYSDLADECQDPRQLDFVVGHEMGHIAAGHLQWNAFLWPFMLLPWFGAAYLRAREYTSDACGHAVVGDLESSMRGLIVLAAGGKHAAQADIKAFMDQRRETGGFWSSVLELVSSHPYLCKRVAALQERHQPGSVVPIARNPLAYPLAPFFGFAAATGPAGGGLGGLLIVVAMIGIIAAIAIPSLLRARVSANESATIGDLRTLVSAQATYSNANGGYFESREECLLTPGRCIPGYTGPAMLTPELTQSPRHGYTFTLLAGQTFATGTAPATVSPSSSNGYAVLAEPVLPGQTGTRAFCADSSGLVCSTAEAGTQSLTETLAEPPGIRCAAVCRPLG